MPAHATSQQSGNKKSNTMPILSNLKKDRVHPHLQALRNYLLLGHCQFEEQDCNFPVCGGAHQSDCPAPEWRYGPALDVQSKRISSKCGLLVSKRTTKFWDSSLGDEARLEAQQYVESLMASVGKLHGVL
eukprot:5394048-Amphidinium_carterae.1